VTQAGLEAADLFKEAANLVPLASAYNDKRIGYLEREARALYQQGNEFGDNRALGSAIERYNRLLDLRPRDRVPLDWARTQMNLGLALWRLGERESGTARRTRDGVPLDWAMTQNNLANALVRLGERESGTARLEEAVAAYRAAMQENTRDRVPLDWAMTQNNLGLALWRLGERESGTARLEEAVAAYRAALQENTRDRVPLEWAMSRRAARQSPDGPTGAGADYSRL
jgi:tetratricopeptide (TPR) repeat protein